MLETKKLLLLDGIGAIVSATSLGLLIPAFNSHFRLPIDILYPLAWIAVVFSIFSFFSYFISGYKWRNFLRIIAHANFSYCVLTGWLIFVSLQESSVLAKTYFTLEMMLVLTLSVWELKVAAQK